MRKKVLLLLLYFASNSKADSVNYTLAQMEQNPSLYLTTIDKITIDSNNLISFEGKKEKRAVISSNTIKSVVNNILGNKADPECSFMHSPEETEAYLTFYEKFKIRPHGSDGTLVVMEWERNKFTQHVNLSNINKNGEFASSLYNADYCLKKIIMGKKLIRAGRMQSFVGHVKLITSDKFKSKSSLNGTGYESIFYLFPDSIVLNVDQGKSYEITKSKFKLTPYNQADTNKIEFEWAKTFNNNYDKIIKKHVELAKLNEIFKLYVLLKLYVDKNTLARYVENESQLKIPDTINSIKFCELIEIYDPLINEPQRVRFLWFLISGGISFDLSKAVVITNKK